MFSIGSALDRGRTSFSGRHSGGRSIFSHDVQWDLKRIDNNKAQSKEMKLKGGTKREGGEEERRVRQKRDGGETKGATRSGGRESPPTRESPC